MMSQEYLISLLTWAGILGGAVVAVLLLVPPGNRRRAVYSTLLFAIPLAFTGFIDGVNKQLGRAECSGGVIAMSILMVLLLGGWESWRGRRKTGVALDADQTPNS